MQPYVRAVVAELRWGGLVGVLIVVVVLLLAVLTIVVATWW
jgi:hypothetical protein